MWERWRINQWMAFPLPTPVLFDTMRAFAKSAGTVLINCFVFFPEHIPRISINLREGSDYKISPGEKVMTLTFLTRSRVLQAHISTLLTHQIHTHTLSAVGDSISAAYRVVQPGTCSITRAFMLHSFRVLYAISIAVAWWSTSCFSSCILRNLSPSTETNLRE